MIIRSVLAVEAIKLKKYLNASQRTRVRVNILAGFYFLLKELLILNNEDPRTARNSFEFNLKPPYDKLYCQLLQWNIFIFFKKYLFI